MNKRKLNIKVLLLIFLFFIMSCNIAKAININELEACSDKYSQQGYGFYKTGNYDKAIEIWSKVLQINLKIYGKNDSKTAMSYFMLGTAYGAKGDYYKALDCLNKDLKINLQKLGEENPDVASTYSSMANIYLQKGDYGNSLAYYIKAIKIFKKTKGENSFDVARCYGCIGAVYDDTGEYNIALDHYYKALHIFQYVNDDNQYDMATIYSNMAKIYYRKMDYMHASNPQAKELLKLHPTVKPTALIMDALLDASAPNSIVLDTFGGSGSTLMAAERTKRRARVMELEPHYCDVILHRWEKMTGKTPILLGNYKNKKEQK